MFRILKIFLATFIKDKSVDLAIVFVLFSWICTIFYHSKWETQEVIKHDIISYYSYLPATFIYHDLSFDFVDDLPQDVSSHIWFHNAPNGNKVQKMNLGLAVLYSPFFFIAHLYANIFNFLANGYSPPYEMFLCFSSVFYALIGLIFLKKLINRYFSDLITLLTIITIGLGTNLFYYVTLEGPMSHAYSFALFAIFLYYCIKWNESPTNRNTVITGIIFGLIVLVRPTNIVIIVILLLYGITNFQSIKERFLWLLSKRRHLIIIGSLALLVFFPQLIYWKYITGDWFYYGYQNERFFFNNPHILDGLLSYRKGWLVYTPVMVLALIGVFLIRKNIKDITLPIVLFTVINIYIVFSWWCWWYGGSFGARALIESYVILSLPLAGFYNRILNIKKIFLRITLYALIAGFVFLNLFQTRQYYSTLIHWDSMTKETYWAVFGQLRFPTNYQELVKTPDYDKALRGEDEY